MNRKVREYLDSEKYLPKFMRDFHDQKDLFKTIHESIYWDKHPELKAVDWVTGHIYVIDIFLWFMAWHGYTLQKSTKQVEFGLLHAKIQLHKRVRQQNSANVLNEGLATKEVAHEDNLS